MVGRRDKKKKETFVAVVMSAAELFDSVGYDGTTVEMIAEASGVSPGTVYNYFGTKSVVLASVVSRYFEPAVSTASNAVDLSQRDPVQAIMPVLDVFLELIVAMDRAMLNELFRSVLEPRQALLLADMVALDERAIEQISVAFARMQDHGLASRDVGVQEAALLMYSILSVAVVVYITIPATTGEAVRSMVTSQLEIAFAGMGPG